MGGLGGLVVVGDHDDSLAQIGVQAFEQGHDVGGGHPVQVAGGFVGHDDVRVGDDGPGDGHALLLAAGKLVGLVVGAVGQAHGGQGGQGVVAPGGGGKACEQKRQLDVFLGGQDRNEVVELEDEAHVAASPHGQFTFRQGGDVRAPDGDAAGVQGIDAGDAI